jgi:hypothetical protein
MPPPANSFLRAVVRFRGRDGVGALLAGALDGDERTWCGAVLWGMDNYVYICKKRGQ